MRVDIEDSKPFLDRLFARLSANEIQVDHLEMDHICYRVASQERYDELKGALEQEADLLAESMIKGRPICTFKLQKPIFYKNRQIEVFELPAPKPSKPYKEGYEHVEFVLKEDFDTFMAKYPDIQFDESGRDKKYNADIRIQFPDCSVKFHRHSLEYVITVLEKE